MAIIHCHWQLGSSMMSLSKINLLEHLNAGRGIVSVCMYIIPDQGKSVKGGIFRNSSVLGSGIMYVHCTLVDDIMEWQRALNDL
jgi:hypothetical protein